MKQSGHARSETIAETGRYLSSVQAMVREQQELVARLESLAQGVETRTHDSQDDMDHDLQRTTAPNNPEGHGMDKVEVLDRALDDSLSEFDAILLQEMERIKQRSAERMSDLSDEATEVAKKV